MTIGKKKSPKTSRETLRLAGARANVVAHLHYRDFLLAVYQSLKASLPRYSYLQFAADLGFSKTNVIHLVVVGKRPLTANAAARVSEALALTGCQRGYFDNLVGYANATDGVERELYFRRMLAYKQRTLGSLLAQAQLRYFSEWYHPVVREMIAMPGFVPDPDWIAARLQPSIRPEQAKASLALLVELGLVTVDPDTNRYAVTDSIVSTGDEVESMGLVRFHQEMLGLATRAITDCDPSQRDISAITICVSEATAERLKQEVQVFRKHLLALADADKHGDRVLQLNYQLFPMTKPAGVAR